MTDEELKEMIERADSNGDGEISFEDFYAIMTKKSFP
ncbi:centrin, caltractin [Gregarina niphandrodes]|nr:centrin, caltractin [Gregarina niphandrodes]EZG69889.1 centrin, caltractin [Gregarina niphandrodes]|eukprot:XP_011129983.1 centrin, caltractin [Gregarina niphandrodes]